MDEKVKDLTEIVENIRKSIKQLWSKEVENEELSKALEILDTLSLEHLVSSKEILQELGCWDKNLEELFDEAQILFEVKIYEKNLKNVPDHPLYKLFEENKTLLKFLNSSLEPHLQKLLECDSQELRECILKDVQNLKQINLHYEKIEKLLFPHCILWGFISATRVMEGMHKDARRMIEDLLDALANPESSPEEIVNFTRYLIGLVKTAIWREEETMLNTEHCRLSKEEWAIIAKKSEEIGYCIIEPTNSENGQK